MKKEDLLIDWVHSFLILPIPCTQKPATKPSRLNLKGNRFGAFFSYLKLDYLIVSNHVDEMFLMITKYLLKSYGFSICGSKSFDWIFLGWFCSKVFEVLKLFPVIGMRPGNTQMNLHLLHISLGRGYPNLHQKPSLPTRKDFGLSSLKGFKANQISVCFKQASPSFCLKSWLHMTFREPQNVNKFLWNWFSFQSKVELYPWEMLNLWPN